ncbi:hypothetical protein B296_00035676, partial [Ensete ventricosum]
AIRLRTIPNVIPSESGRAADFSGFLDAVFTRMGDPFERLLDELEPAPAAIVADSYLPWAVAVGNRRGIPVASLFTMSAAFFSVMYHLDRVPGLLRPQVSVPDHMTEDLLAQWIPGLPSVRLADFIPLLRMKTPSERVLETSWIPKAQIVLFTTFYELEPRVLDSLRSELSFPVYSVGPCIPYMLPQVNSSIPCSGNEDDYFSWLDSQTERSVLYVSLGSFLSVSNLQMEEIAMGLCASQPKFLWVARGDSLRIQQMCGRSGLVVPWCDQLRVLHHPSVGGFLTHCGWNSTLEAVFAGVPMLTFPLLWDQIANSRLVVEEWKVGLGLKEKLGDDNVIGRDDIAMLVKRLMESDGLESAEMRRRSTELRMASLKAIEEGGSSCNGIITFLHDLMKCND